jgi:murein DD-endopeptidase MepM/ murein hydrolase activator NlpD
MLHYSGSVPSQLLYDKSYPLNYFHQPLKNELELAGCFGELRPNHFHSGWDFKTNNQIGYPVYTSQIGFVSRIKLSDKGYGLAVYVTHPNGFTTVYAHLSKLSDKLNSYLIQQQKSENKINVDFKLGVNKLKVYPNEVIAKSGNSGSSQAPHLHFEIRDAFTEEAINPAFFGFSLIDKTPPTINKIGIYVSNISTPNPILKQFNIAKNELSNGKLNLTIIVNDSIVGVAISGFDNQEFKDKSELGFTSIELIHQQKSISKIYFDRLVFAENKRIYNMTDTIQQKKQNVDWYKLYLPKQNISSFYKNKNNGIVVLKKNKIENFEVIVSDFNKNTRRLKFSVMYKPKLSKNN